MNELKYNHMEWDKTDKEEVDLINAALAVSVTPVHALDAILDAGHKLILAIEDADDIFEVQAIKMRSIIVGFEKLANRVEDLNYIEVL